MIIDKEINPLILFGAKKIYFIGIGGIGMSAVARMMLGEGKKISGSDQARSVVTEELEKLGLEIFYEQKAENITADIDLIVYTIAIPDDHPELAKARKLGINCQTYPEMLGLISADKYTIAVAGTHGKTTTTAMIAEMLIATGLEPTVIVGSLLKSGTNFIAGQSRYLVVEACEYRRSFLNLRPQLVIITNIDSDHLDYYQDLTDIQKAFIEFIDLLPADGCLICAVADPLLQPIVKQAKLKKIKIIDYSKLKDESDKLQLSVPGYHNILNAQCALAVAEALKLDLDKARNSLERFEGTWRRFEFKGKTDTGALIYDDYAHHPTEISATIDAARDFLKENNLSGKLIIVFQPHLYSRTKLLKDNFVEVLSSADEIILAPIYAARESFDSSITSEMLMEAIKSKNKQVVYFANFVLIAEYLKEHSQVGDLILIAGAGDINTLSSILKQ